ncbi:MAG: 50S ribosomal protein L17 [Candidatus Bipolaricaulota bacterium]
MRHRDGVEKIGMVASHRRRVLANLTNALILHSKVDTTFVRAKAGQRYAERLITLARRGDLHARRIAFARLQDKAAVDRLFGEIGPRLKEKAGGYTRVVKLGPRRGDGAEQARLMLLP